MLRALFIDTTSIDSPCSYPVSYDVMERARLTLRIDEVTKRNAEFWATHSPAGAMSLNEFIVDAVEEKVSRLSGHIPDVDNIIVNRLNQLQDQVVALRSDLNNVNTIVVNGFDSIVAMGNGSNFLLDDFDGEADAVEEFRSRALKGE